MADRPPAAESGTPAPGEVGREALTFARYAPLSTAHDRQNALRQSLAAALREHWWSATDDETCSCGWVAPMWADAGTGNDDEAERTAMDTAHTAFLEHQAAALASLLSASPASETAGHPCDECGHVKMAHALDGSCMTSPCPCAEYEPASETPGPGEGDLRGEVVTLCGSTRFKDAFHAENQRLTMEGRVVISLGVYGHTDLPDYDWTTDASDLKRTLDGLHFQKIDMADRVHVVNVGGYVGESTQREIAYARSRGLPVTFMDETAGAESQVRGGITPFSSRERLDGPPAPAIRADTAVEQRTLAEQKVARVEAGVEARKAAYGREGMGDFRDGYTAALDDVLTDLRAALAGPEADR